MHWGRGKMFTLNGVFVTDLARKNVEFSAKSGDSVKYENVQ